MKGKKLKDQAPMQTKLLQYWGLSEENFPVSGEEWQIILASKKLLDFGAKHAKFVVGMDARWKNTDLRRPLTVLTGACKGRTAFPIAVMISNTATSNDYLCEFHLDKDWLDNFQKRVPDRYRKNAG